MVDDAPGLGVIGKGGRGTASHFGLDADVDLVMGTFSKSLASLGGFVAGRREVIDYLRHSSFPFVFSAAVTPASVATALAALRHLKAHPELPERLRGVSDFARKAFAERGIPLVDSAKDGITPILPIPTGGTMETCIAAKRMFDGGVFVNPFVPPGVPEGHSLIRTSFMATHTNALVEEAADVIAEARPAGRIALRREGRWRRYRLGEGMVLDGNGICALQNARSTRCVAARRFRFVCDGVSRCGKCRGVSWASSSGTCASRPRFWKCAFRHRYERWPFRRVGELPTRQSWRMA